MSPLLAALYQWQLQIGDEDPAYPILAECVGKLELLEAKAEVKVVTRRELK